MRSELRTIVQKVEIILALPLRIPYSPYISSQRRELKPRKNEQMKTTTMIVSTKKGESQILRFLIVQETPYPDIERFQWRNFGGIFPQYQRPAEGIGSKYYCYLLADNAPKVVPDDYNRTIFAGYADYRDKTKVNGGTFKLRGRDLGEMSIRFDANPDYPEIKVNGFERPSNGERSAIVELIVPALRQFIAVNRAELKAQAVAKIKARFDSVIRDAKEQLNNLEKQAAEAVY
jgi:hypothetical protein